MTFGSTVRPLGDSPLLAFNDPWHDSSFFLSDSRGSLHVESERFTRRKYEPANPMVVFCELFPERVHSFNTIGVQINGEVQRYATELAAFKHGRSTAESPPEMPVADRELPPDPALKPERARTPAVQAFSRHLQRQDVHLYFFGHYACHAANAYYSSRCERALVVCLDGGGMDYRVGPSDPLFFTEAEVALRTKGTGRHAIYGAIYHGEGNALKLVQQVKDLSVGGMWTRVIQELMGLKPGEEGTAMAMAALGDPQRFERQFAEAAICYPLEGFLDDGRLSELQRWLADMKPLVRSDQDMFDVAAAMQQATERVVKGVLQQYLRPEHEALCLAGGVFLNCLLTGKIQRWFPWLRSVYIPPAPYDGGLSVGAGQLIHHVVRGEHERFSQDGTAPFAMGEQYSRQAVLEAAEAQSIPAHAWTDADCVAALSEGKLVAIFQGSAESGRRALGHRSILAHPGFAGMKERINEVVKHRQWYRPFAPMVLAEHVSDWFECDEGFESPYMSFAVPVRSAVREQIQNVVHLDGTARLQTVHSALTPRMHSLLKAWYQRTGVPVLLNTSFNDREPIVETPSDALRTFGRTPLDHIYFADHGVAVSSG